MNRKPYLLKRYTVDDFVADDTFQSYVLKKDQEDVIFWTNWRRSHPEKEMDMEEAEHIILYLRSNTDLSKYQAEAEQEWEKLNATFQNKSTSPKFEDAPRNLDVINSKVSNIKWAELFKIGVIITFATIIILFILNHI